MDREYVAKEFNKYFSNVGVNLKNKIEAGDLHSMNIYHQIFIFSIVLYNTNPIKVFKTITNINSTLKHIKKTGSKTCK